MKTFVTLFTLALFLCCQFSFAQSPVAVNDTIHYVQNGDTITVNVVQNDYNPDGHPFFITAAPGSYSHTDSTITYIINYQWYANGIQTPKSYIIIDTVGIPNASTASVYLILNNPFFDYLDINRVSCRINNNGNHFWDFENAGHYNVPKGSNQNALFAYATWFAGTDVNGQLHLAADRYGSNGQDFWSGPVSNPLSYNHTYDSLWSRVWKINRSEINYHKTHWWISGYQAPEVILHWPGNGNTALGQMAQLAPYYDVNNNGVYEPMNGDYPLIKGDQAVFFIQNDAKKVHTETQGTGLGIEIHGMAYAFDCQDDSALLYTTFLHYDVYNRSTNTYSDAYFGTFADLELGNAWDDYVGCDVGRGSFYGYNGIPTSSYNAAISTTILGGPYIDPDNLDNPKFGQFGNPLCAYNINGANFADGIVDNERYGMNTFMYYNNASSGPTSDPQTQLDYYNLLKCTWKDGVHMKYGGNGHPNSGSGMLDCNFMFPALSDFCDWGTNGVNPPGYQTGAGGTGIIWNEENSGNPPDDRRGFSSMGPFTFQAGAKHELDLAFVWACDYTSSTPANAVTLLQSRIDQIKDYYQRDSTPCGVSFTGIINPKNPVKNIGIYPNPTQNQLFIQYDNTKGNAVYSIMEITGKHVSSGSLDKSNLSQVFLSNLSSGMYILQVKDGNSLITKKFIKQ